MRKASFREAEDLSAGLDECGMGPLAGPICAVAVVFRNDTPPIEGVTDSKKLTPKRRMELAPIIMREAVFFGIGWAHPQVIDERGVAEAWRRACLDALEGAPPSSLLRIDGVRTVHGYPGPQECFVKGDSRFWHIGAASIVAKVARDLEMIGMDLHYPQYKWKKNMGYGSSDHIEALLRYGPSPYHRGSYLQKLYASRKAEAVTESWAHWEGRWLNPALEDY